MARELVAPGGDIEKALLQEKLARGQLEKKVLARELDDEISESLLLAGVMMVAILMMWPFIQQSMALAASPPRAPALTEGLEPVAANVGLLWLQVTSAGRPNEFRIVTENSTGAFEQMLVGLST